MEHPIKQIRLKNHIRSISSNTDSFNSTEKQPREKKKNIQKKGSNGDSTSHNINMSAKTLMFG